MKALLFALLAIVAALSSTQIALADSYPLTEGGRYQVTTSSDMSSTCPAPSSVTTNGTTSIRLGENDSVNHCTRTSFAWDISSIPDDVMVQSVEFQYDLASEVGTRACQFKSLENNPIGQSATDLWTDIGNGTTFVTTGSSCLTNALTIQLLGDDAKIDVEENLDDDWWGFGLKYVTEGRESGTIQEVLSDYNLRINYTTIDGIDFSCEFNDDPNDYSVDCDWLELEDTFVAGFKLDSNNGSGWFTLQNDTGNTAPLFYNDTSLDQNLWHAYNITTWRTLGDDHSTWVNVTTIDPVEATLTTTAEIVGDIMGTNGTFNPIGAFPDIQTINQIRTWVNGSIVDTSVLSETFSTFSELTHYVQVGNTNTTAQHEVRVINFTGDTVLVTSPSINATENYDPAYFTSKEGNYQVNYTTSRTNNGAQLNLDVNRDPINFQIECNYRNATESFRGLDGSWSNHTDVGFLSDEQQVPAQSNIYVRCFNDELLFQFTSYSPANATLASIASLEESLGDFFGVPLGLFFVLLVAGLATGRSAPTFLVIVIGTVGIMAALGFFVIEAETWALIIIGGAIGVLAGKKFL